MDIKKKIIKFRIVIIGIAIFLIASGLASSGSMQDALNKGTWTSGQSNINPSGSMQDALNKGTWTSTQSNASQSMQNALNAGTWLSSQSSYSNAAQSMQSALNNGTWTSVQGSGSMQEALSKGTWTSTQTSSAGGAGAPSGGIPPCPVVTDLSLPQMCMQWATSLAQPYTTFTEEKFQLMMKQKMQAGIFDATQLFNLYGEFNRISTDVQKDILDLGNGKLAWLKRMVGLEDIKAPERKLTILRMQATAVIFAGGKKTYELAEENDKLISKYTPMQFDYASKHQVIKDMVKMAEIQSYTQAQTLWLLSNIKIQEALAKR